MKVSWICALVLFENTILNKERLKIETDLLNFLHLSRIHNLFAFWKSYEVEKENKMELLEIIVSNNLLKTYLLALIDLSLITQIPEIITEYSRMLDLEIGRLNVLLVSANHVTDAQALIISNKISEIKNGKYVNLTRRVDSSIIAGCQIYFDNIVIDTSLKTYLMDLGQLLCI
ncbi:MAG: ATP synthase F1 subunit delta [Deltaproteobacteria bacterium]|nr:MAG: ATP synthase F1 subunit delta [Deltaproteobacteria bacterium]